MGLKIAVCIKVAPDPEQYNRIRLDPVKNTLIREGIDSVICTTDLHAIELALQLKGKFGGSVTLLTMGPPSCEKQLRDGLGYGCDAACLLSDRKLGGADTLATSYTLSKGLEKLGGFDLILLGSASDDGATSHVPSQLGEWMGLPHVTDVISFTPEGPNSALVSKEIGDRVNTYRVHFPAVIGVTKRLNTVRHQNVMAILTAKNKPLTVYTAADLEANEAYIGLNGSPTRAIGYVSADFHRDCVEIKGSSTEIAAEILKTIRTTLK